MKTMFWHELKINSKGLLLWLVVMVMLAGMGSSEYSLLASGGESITLAINAMPRIARIMFGIYDNISIATPIGYYVCMFLWYCMVAYTHAAYVGATIISSEERDKTAEYIFTKPYSRSKIIRAKVLAAVVNISAMTIVTWLMTIFTMVPQMNGANITKLVAMTMLGMFFTQLIFMVLGLLCSSIFRTQTAALRFSTFLVVIFYTLSIIIEYTGNFSITFLSPFWYFNAPALLSQGFSVLNIILTVIIIIIGLWGMYTKYDKRDLYC